MFRVEKIYSWQRSLFLNIDPTSGEIVRFSEPLHGMHLVVMIPDFVATQQSGVRQIVSAKVTLSPRFEHKPSMVLVGVRDHLKVDQEGRVAEVTGEGRGSDHGLAFVRS